MTAPGARTYTSHHPERNLQWQPSCHSIRPEQVMQGAHVTTETQADQQEPPEKYSLKLLNAIPNGTIFAYNLDEMEMPGGMKVRWKIRVANGPEAARWDARQAEAIREALVWLRKQQTRTGR
jgi:hypothetical protein